KSTLLKAIAGIIAPANGKVSFADGRRPPIAYLPQVTHMQRDFPITVGETVVTGLYPNLGETRDIGGGARGPAATALEEVGLTGYATRHTGALPGGEFQRALFARAIVQDAPVVLLDEPFTAIDAETTARLIRLLLAWHKEGRTII